MHALAFFVSGPTALALQHPCPVANAVILRIAAVFTGSGVVADFRVDAVFPDINEAAAIHTPLVAVLVL